MNLHNLQLEKKDDKLKQSKSFEIPEHLVWESYQTRRKNRGSSGFDGVTITEFDRDRDKSLYKIWNRLSSGTYFPPPVLEKDIPKLDGGVRKLGIPTVSDRIAQGAVKIYLERIGDGHLEVTIFPGKRNQLVLLTKLKRNFLD